MNAAIITRAEDRPFQSLDWSIVLAVSLIWGSSFLFMAIGLESFEPGLVSLLRVGFGAVTVAFLPGARQPVPRSAWRRIVVLGLVWLAFPLSLFPIAQQWIDSSVAGMLNSAMPLMTLFIAWAAFSTPTGPRRLLGVLVGLVGIILIGAPEVSTAGTNAVGVVLVVMAVMSYGVAVNIAGPLQREYGSEGFLDRMSRFM